MVTITEVEKLAFDLPDCDRAVLAAHLLRSLPPVLDDEDEGIAEAVRRDADLDANPGLGITVDQLDQQIRDRRPLMQLVLHPQVHSDVDAIMGYYERVGSPDLADDFYTELRGFMLEAAERPESFSIRERDLRRVRLHRFPYHFLFRVVDDAVRILVVRHHRRHPSLGVHRQ